MVRILNLNIRVVIPIRGFSSGKRLDDRMLKAGVMVDA
jgi:hypothetical protein